MIGERMQVWLVPIQELGRVEDGEHHVSSFSWRKLKWEKKIAIINNKKRPESVILYPPGDPESTKELKRRQINRAHLRIVEPHNEGPSKIDEHLRLIYRKKQKITLIDKICKTARENLSIEK